MAVLMAKTAIGRGPVATTHNHAHPHTP